MSKMKYELVNESGFNEAPFCVLVGGPEGDKFDHPVCEAPPAMSHRDAFDRFGSDYGPFFLRCLRNREQVDQLLAHLERK